jgi:hypothetical protein
MALPAGMFCFSRSGPSFWVTSNLFVHVSQNERSNPPKFVVPAHDPVSEGSISVRAPFPVNGKGYFQGSVRRGGWLYH